MTTESRETLQARTPLTEPKTPVANRGPGVGKAPDGMGPLLLTVLALLSTVAPFATDLYLPAFPQMVNDLRTDSTGVQLTLTTFLLGIAGGQLCFGPLSDRFGRKGPLLIGSILCLIASAVAATAPTVEVLILARLVQGFGGAAGVVIGRAIIADVASGIAAVRAFNLLMVVGGIAPVVAPMLGGFMLDPLGWRGIMWVLFGLVALMVISVIFVLRDTTSRGHRLKLHNGPKKNASAIRQLKSRVYLGNALTFALAFSILMAYISASPFLYQTMMGLNALQYGLFFALNATGFTLTSMLSNSLANRFPIRALIGIGLTIVVMASTSLLLMAITDVPAIWMAVAVFFAAAALGLVFGNVTSLAMAEVQRVAGAGSAVLGALQFGLGAIVSPLVGLAGEHTAVPLGIVMTSAAFLSCAAFLWARPKHHLASL